MQTNKIIKSEEPLDKELEDVSNFNGLEERLPNPLKKKMKT